METVVIENKLKKEEEIIGVGGIHHVSAEPGTGI